MKQNLGVYTAQIEFFYIIVMCYYLKMVNIRKPLQKESHHKTINQLKAHDIFY